MSALTVASWAVRVAGLLVLLLGLLIWTANGAGIRGIHMLLGLILVVSLWSLAFLAWRGGVSPWLAGLAFIWGVVTIVLGLTQERLLPGDQHWPVQVAHLVVGVVAIGIGEIVAMRAARATARA